MDYGLQTHQMFQEGIKFQKLAGSGYRILTS